jgi:hypothetical protein
MLPKLNRMEVIFDTKKELLIVGKNSFKLTSKVRNELDGSRKLHLKSDVIYSTNASQIKPPDLWG